jgi:thiamine transport system substrate-binding protein
MAGVMGGLAACSVVGGAGQPQAATDVVLVTHDSFVLPKPVIARFEHESGYHLVVQAVGDGGTLTNKLVLTQGDPTGDVAFGVDNTFASRALDEGVFAPYTSPAAGNGSATYSTATDGRLTAVDYSDVCVNVDEKWFAGKNIQPPTSYEDLTKPEYKDLFVVPSPATSSPGLAFLLGTIAHFGADKWQAYWQQLKDNGVKITAGWNDAYTVDFSGSTGKGDRPLVLSYASSPPFEAAAGDTAAPTAALLNTCFRQIEYVGVLEGAQNPSGAQKVVDWMLSNGFQAAVAKQMYVYPVDAHTALPADWKKFAPVATAPAQMDPAEITANRESWISAWSDLMES